MEKTASGHDWDGDQRAEDANIRLGHPALTLKPITENARPKSRNESQKSLDESVEDGEFALVGRENALIEAWQEVDESEDLEKSEGTA